MITKEIIETMGKIVKEETLTSVDYNILPKTMVLENSEPFPGYFGTRTPKDSVPRSIFLITAKKYKEDNLKRILAAIKKDLGHSCDITNGSIEIFSRKFDCLRLKGLTCFDHIPKIQNMLLDKGIKFECSKKINAKGRIVLHKYFKIEQSDEGLFKNLVQTDQYFIIIPLELEWTELCDITARIKQNIDNSLFDAAMGYMYRENSIVDFIRIFDKDHSPERMKKIRDMYLNEISRMRIT